MKKIFSYILLLTLVACASPRPNFYSPVALKEAGEYYPSFKSTVLIGNVLMPSIVSKPQLVTVGNEDYQINIDEFNRWASAPDKLMQNVLNQDLSILLPNAIIENQTMLRKNYKYMVAVEVNEMQARLNKDVLLKASYYIKNSQNHIIKQGKFAKIANIDGGYNEYITMLSLLFGDLAKKIAFDLSQIK